MVGSEEQQEDQDVSNHAGSTVGVQVVTQAEQAEEGHTSFRAGNAVLCL